MHEFSLVSCQSYMYHRIIGSEYTLSLMTYFSGDAVELWDTFPWILRFPVHLDFGERRMGPQNPAPVSKQLWHNKDPSRLK